MTGGKLNEWLGDFNSFSGNLLYRTIVNKEPIIYKFSKPMIIGKGKGLRRNNEPVILWLQPESHNQSQIYITTVI